jgi:hypothetical protein
MSDGTHAPDNQLPPHVGVARAEYAALRAANGDSLGHALNLGDAAIQIGETAPKRGRQRYLCAIIGAPKSTIIECIRLARNRAAIEAAFDLDGAPSR